MWKATAGVKPSISAKPSGKPSIPKKKDLTADDEWDTDPDFVVCSKWRRYAQTVVVVFLREGERFCILLHLAFKNQIIPSRELLLTISWSKNKHENK